MKLNQEPFLQHCLRYSQDLMHCQLLFVMRGSGWRAKHQCQLSLLYHTFMKAN